jgi:phage nucleotide-binding protein
MEIKKTSAKDALRISSLIYGKSGSGKTTLASTLEGKTLVISAESGLLSLSDFEIDYVEITSIKELGDIVTKLEGGSEYQNIFLDSLTEVAQILVSELQKKFPDRKDSFPLWQEYTVMIRKIIKRFRDLSPYNVFITALDKVEVDELNNRFVIPDMNGKIAAQVVQFFDEVFYLVVNKDGERKLLTGSSEKVLVKDRSGKLEQYEPPVLKDIVAKIKGE